MLPFTACPVVASARRAAGRAFPGWIAAVEGGVLIERPKALSDAKRQRLALDRVRDAAGHSPVLATEGGMRDFDAQEVNHGRALPEAMTAV